MTGEPTILLVEDDPNRVVLTRHALEQSGFTNPVLVAKDGVEALELLFDAEGEPGALPGLILLDLKLPRMDGFQVLDRVRADERTRNLPVVVLTSSSEDSDRQACYRRGANSYITKPVDYDEFIETIEQIGRYWLDVNVQPPDH